MRAYRGRATVTATALAAVLAVVGVALAIGGTVVTPDPASATPTCAGGSCGLQRAVSALVRAAGGPPGAIVVVQRGAKVTTYSAGVAELGTAQPPTASDQMRLASVSKAFSGAAALALVSAGRLSLNDTIGKWLPSLPKAWWPITLRRLLNHTSRIPDFSAQPAFITDLTDNLLSPPPPADLLSYVEKLALPPKVGTGYSYSNSDNIIVGLMIEAATGKSYASVLQSKVLGPLGLDHTTFPTDQLMPSPTMHGYDISQSPPEDQTDLFAAGWTWAAGAVVSTPLDANRFVRGYVAGRLISKTTQSAQFQFVPGNSEPPGPGTNSAGLALFRYQTSCGTVYGHTGNTAGYTQFAAASRDGSESVTVSVNAQISPKVNSQWFAQLRELDLLGVCAALS